MMAEQKRGRPTTSNRVHVTPEFRREPDIEKLGRALIAIAVDMAEKKNAGNTVDINIDSESHDNTKIRILQINGEGDGMT